MAHIVIDARELRTSTGRYIERLLHYLQDLDKANRYTVLLKPADFDGWVPKSSNFNKLICPYKEFSFGEQFGYSLQLYKLRPDLVHFPLVQHPIFYFGKSVIGILDLTTLRFRNPAKNPVIFWLKQRIYYVVILAAILKAKIIITISEYVKDDLELSFRVNPERIITTYNAADELPRPSKSIADLRGKDFIMYVGRHQPHKNLPRLIEAHQALLKKHPSLLLVIAGRLDKTSELLKEDIKQKNYKNIHFTGYVDDHELRWLYENTMCYTFPSLSEGFGLPGLEAMLHGAPVASSNTTCLPEIYGDAAKYFDPKDVKDMADSIDLVLSDADLRKKLTTKGYRRAKMFSWKRMAEQTVEAYEQALGM